MMRCLFIMLAAGLVVACGSSANRLPDAGRPDAARPDAGQPDAPPIDPPPDGPPPIDVDRDGVPAGEDCNDHDPALLQNLPYSFRDADGDDRTVAESGVVCSGLALPPGYLTVAGDPDCDDGDAAVFALLTGFADTDGDGFGDGIAMAFCTGGSLPAGFVAVDGDCAAGDAARWVERPYSFRDADGDGAAVPETGVVCSGNALPPGYLTSAPIGRPLDCDDGDPAVSIALTVFADGDGDGVGAGAGQLACTDGTAPPGFSLTSTDCDDGNPALFVSLVYTAVDFDADTFTIPSMGTRCTAGTLLPPFFATPHGFDCDDGNDRIWQLVTFVAIDEDNDGATVPASGQLCTDGTLPPPHHATPSGNDCNDHDATLTHFAVLYPDGDHDGIGAPPRQVHCLGATTPDGLVSRGYDEDDADPDVIETEELDDLLELIVLGD
jgi:hypothetical protein